MNKENCALKLVDEIILYYDARSKKTSNSENIVFPKERVVCLAENGTKILRTVICLQKKKFFPPWISVFKSGVFVLN